jgi:hypothetical protein
MPFIPFENVAEVLISQSMSGQVVDDVISFLFDSPLTESILNNLAVAVIAKWIDSWSAVLSQDLDLNTVKATDLTTSSSPAVIVAAPAGTDGADSDEALPLNAAIVITEYTPLRGRSYRGRYYVCGMPNNITADRGSILTAYQTDLLGAFTDFITGIETSSGAAHVVLSRQNDGVVRTTGVATEISSYACNVDIDSQRRRLKGRGI